MQKNTETDHVVKGFHKEWSNIVREGRDGYLRFDYSMTTPLLWSALQYALNEIDEMKDFSEQ